MRVAQMREREDFEAHLLATLARGWSEQYAREIVVSPQSIEGGVSFRTHKILGAFYTRRLGPQGRKFLRDSLRFTPRRRRLLAQWIATDLVGHWIGLRALSDPAFWVSADLPNPEQLLVVAGNQRIRIFDFARMRARVLLKEGFQKETMEREIMLRTSGVQGPFHKIHAFCPQHSFFEEELLQGWDLNRVPPWLNRKKLKKSARKLLLRWLERTRESADRDGYLDDVAARFRKASQEVQGRFGPVFPQSERWLELLGARAADLPTSIQLALTHGDFQWGNVFFERKISKICLIDWEHQGKRSFHHDFFTEALGARRGVGMARRISAYLEGKTLGSPIDDIGGTKRVALLALFLLENLIFFLEESLTGPTLAPSQGLLATIDELAPFGHDLGGILGERPC